MKSADCVLLLRCHLVFWHPISFLLKSFGTIEPCDPERIPPDPSQSIRILKESLEIHQSPKEFSKNPEKSCDDPENAVRISKESHEILKESSEIHQRRRESLKNP